MDAISERARLAHDWRKRPPHDSAPCASIIGFLVCKGNPKGIGDWADLARPA